METPQNEILDSALVFKESFDRRKLLPWWIKIFAWIFMVFGVVAPIGLMLGLFGYSFQLLLYGLQTNQPFSLTGLLLLAIFLLKGISAYGLWTRKDWAITLGILDSILGIVICGYVAFVYPFIDNTPGFTLDFRFELLLLIPYLIKLTRIKQAWEGNLQTDR
jgi:hypothetical protein